VWSFIAVFIYTTLQYLRKYFVGNADVISCQPDGVQASSTFSSQPLQRRFLVGFPKVLLATLSSSPLKYVAVLD